MEAKQSYEHALYSSTPQHSISEELKLAIQHLIERLRQNQPASERDVVCS